MTTRFKYLLMIVTLLIIFLWSPVWCQNDDGFFKTPGKRKNDFFDPPRLREKKDEPSLTTSPDEFDTSNLLSRRQEFFCARRCLLLYKLIINSISNQFHRFSDASIEPYENLDIRIKIYAYEVEELDDYLAYLSKMLTYEFEHLEGDLLLETQYFCENIDHIEQKVLQFIRRFEHTKGNKTSLLTSLQRNFEWIRIDIEHGTKDTLEFYAFTTLLAAIFFWAIYYYAPNPLSRAALAIMNLIVFYSFLEYYHELKTEFETNQDRLTMLEAFTQDTNKGEAGASWWYKYLPTWKKADALEAQLIGVGGQQRRFKPKFLDLSMQFFLHYQRFIWRNMVESLTDFVDFFYKPDQMANSFGGSIMFYYFLRPLLVFSLILLLLYFGLLRTFSGGFFSIFDWIGGKEPDLNGNGTSSTSTTTTSITYNVHLYDNARLAIGSSGESSGEISPNSLGCSSLPNKTSTPLMIEQEEKEVTTTNFCQKEVLSIETLPVETLPIEISKPKIELKDESSENDEAFLEKKRVDQHIAKLPITDEDEKERIKQHILQFDSLSVDRKKIFSAKLDEEVMKLKAEVESSVIVCCEDGSDSDQSFDSIEIIDED